MCISYANDPCHVSLLTVMIYYNDTIIICLAQCVYAEYVGGGMVPGGHQPMIMARYQAFAPKRADASWKVKWRR